jgi:hypothetical protein
MLLGAFRGGNPLGREVGKPFLCGGLAEFFNRVDWVVVTLESPFQ